MREEIPLLSFLLLIHERLATSILLFMLAVGLWGLFSFLRGESLGGSLAGALVIGEGLVILQGLAGIFLYADGARPPTMVHFLYGITAALVLPFVWSYTRERHPRQSLLLLSLVALFIFGLAIRGIETGH